MVRFGAVEKVEVPSRHRATAVVCVDSWHGDLARSRLCVRQFIAEQRRDDIVAGTVGTFFLAKNKSAVPQRKRTREFSFLTFALLSCMLDPMNQSTSDLQEKYWRLTTAMNGTRRASPRWQGFSAEREREMSYV